MPVFVNQNFGTISRIIHDGEEVDLDALHVRHNYGLMERQEPQDQPSKRSRKPISVHQADFAEIKSWLHSCEHDHPPCSGGPYGSHDCDETSDLPFVTSIRLIDVRDQCIVQVHSPPRYLALSYVWGDGRHLHYSRANSTSLTQKGGLGHVQIPKTVEDAIALVAKIGERYLWVDALCILQDDPEDTTLYIQRMSYIYSNAIATVIAGVAEDSDSGLSRVNSPARNRGCSGESSLCLERINAKIGDSSDSDSSIPPNYADPSDSWHSLEVYKWISRAWTFQETILSKRLLIILKERVLLACEHALFSEGEDIAAPIVHPRYEFFHKKMERRTSLEVYEHCVYSYSRMALTYSTDILRAFDGILSRLRYYLRSRFIFGLPETELESALAWRGGDTNDCANEIRLPLRRRINATTGEDYCPSWSWAGWLGGVHYDYAIW